MPTAKRARLGGADSGDEDEPPARHGDHAGTLDQDIATMSDPVMNPADAFILMEVRELLSETKLDRSTQAGWISSIYAPLKAFLVSLKPCELKASDLCPGYCK